MTNALSPTMTVRDFENGYWYLDQLKNFAERIGIPAAKRLRKDELEGAIVAFLRTGTAVLPTKRSLRKRGLKDVEHGLALKRRIENYTSNRETKDFIIEQARIMAPDVREKSGVWYRLNRWREEQIGSRGSTSPRTMRRGSRHERTARETTGNTVSHSSHLMPVATRPSDDELEHLQRVGSQSRPPDSRARAEVTTDWRI